MFTNYHFIFICCVINIISCFLHIVHFNVELRGLPSASALAQESGGVKFLKNTCGRLAGGSGSRCGQPEDHAEVQRLSPRVTLAADGRGAKSETFVADAK